MRALILSTAVAALVACGGNSNGGGQAENPENQGRPRAAANLRVQHDLMAMVHLADIEHRGLFIDFGSPSRAKYTVGNWNSGFGADGADGDTTFTYVDDTARIYFPLRAAGALTLRFQMKPVGSRRMQIFLNGDRLEGVVLEEGEQFRTYDVIVPAGVTRAGENYLLLRFGGVTPVDGRDVSVALGSLRVLPGSIPAQGGDFHPPSHDTLVSAVELGDVERQALAIAAPTTLSYHLEVPASGQLVLGLGAEGEDHQATIAITPEGGETATLFDGALGNAWNDQAIDLGRWAGQVVRLDFAAAGSTTGRVAFSTPAVMVPPPTVAARPTAPRNVIVLLIDTLRADRLRPYDSDSRVQTPVFDRIAAEGVLFEQAQSPENWTKPSCASVLTGLSPETHGAKFEPVRLNQNAELLSETLQGAGFATGSFIANGHVSREFGFDQGWDEYRNYIRSNQNTEAENVFREAGDWIAENRGERFFAYIQTIDPHVPYDPPGDLLRLYDRRDYSGAVNPRTTAQLLTDAKQGRITISAADRRRLEALYDAEISYHDRELGRFLERLAEMDLDDDTLLVITSDHGEEFNDHGKYGHGHSIYQELLGVPLVFHTNGLASRRVPYTVSTMNIAQTVLDLVGVEGMARAEGRSLVPDLLGDVPVGPQVAFSDFQDIRRVARAGRYKLVLRANLSSVFFDLGADPGEQRERSVNELPIASRYTRVLLGQWLGATDRAHWLDAEQEMAPPVDAQSMEVDDVTRAQLEAMGYAN